jgi:hypothetical protein
MGRQHLPVGRSVRVSVRKHSRQDERTPHEASSTAVLLSGARTLKGATGMQFCGVVVG